MKHPNAEAAHAANNAVIAIAQRAAAQLGVHLVVIVAAERADAPDPERKMVVGADGSRSVVGTGFGLELATLGYLGFQVAGETVAHHTGGDESADAFVAEANAAFNKHQAAVVADPNQALDLFRRDVVGDGSRPAQEHTAKPRGPKG